jgi:hypothetical protein
MPGLRRFAHPTSVSFSCCTLPNLQAADPPPQFGDRKYAIDFNCYRLLHIPDVL